MASRALTGLDAVAMALVQFEQVVDVAARTSEGRLITDGILNKDWRAAAGQL